ncbi:hypothetical protein FRC06_010808, partial [Ceratobasidium sp. 370]
MSHEQGEELRLVPWQDLDLDGPRPWFFNRWAVMVLRLEHGKASDAPRRPGAASYAWELP